jgi:gamma-glutamylcyclotransferase
MLHFAFGSNMDPDQMTERCSSTIFVGIALLPDHRLDFTRKSDHRGCGVAGVVEAPGEGVWGVVYEIDDAEVKKLDQHEGYKPGRRKNDYTRRKVSVLQGGVSGDSVTAEAYFATPQPNPPKPNGAYKAQLLKGARHWGLPPEWVGLLERIETDD